jgi:hypothetical protein
MKYTIQFSETHVKEVTIEAANERDALDKFDRGDGWCDDSAVTLECYLEDDYQIVGAE